MRNLQKLCMCLGGIALDTWMVYAGKITGDVWAEVLIAMIALFITGNVISKWSPVAKAQASCPTCTKPNGD